MAFSTIWSIDVGRSSLKAVQLRRDQNNIEIMAVDKIDYPIGKNGVDAAAAGREALGIFRSRHGVRGPVAVVHPGQGTFSRFIKVPAFDEKRVNEMVGYEASQQIPFPLDEVTWDFHIVQRDYLPGEEREIALFAIRREAVDDFLVDFANESLDVELISIGYLGVLNFVAHDIRPEEASIVLDLGAAHTDLILVDGSRFWIRPIPHSGGDMTRAIMSRFRLAYPEAERLKLESSRAPKQAIKIFQAVIQPKLKELVGEIHRSIGFYRSQAGELNFKRLYLLGNGSKTIGIKKFLEEQLAIPVVRVQSIQHFRVNRDVDLKLLQTQLPSFASALGCALQGVGTALCEVDLVPREDKLRREIGRKRKHAFVAAGIILLAMLLSKLLLGNKLAAISPALTDAGQTVRACNQAEKEIASVISAEGGSGGLDALLAQMEELRKLGETRPLLEKGLQAVQTVLAEQFTNAREVTGAYELKKAGEEEKAAALVEKYKSEDIFGKLWVPWQRVQQVIHDGKTEVSEGRVRGAPSVAAYKFEVYVMVKARADRVDSDKFIREKFATPLETELRKQLDLMPEAKVDNLMVHPGSDGLISIRFDDASRTSESAEPQEGGPFYGALVSWYLLPRLPPAPEPEEEPSRERR